MMDVDARRTQLEARLKELRARLDRIEDELEEPVSDRFNEQAVEREDDEVLEDLGAAGLREIRMIEAALQRIEAGTYGSCANCGAPIEPERLNAIPAAPLCAVCASSH
jgi:RNA polymerase-binding transcription factor DksA